MAERVAALVDGPTATGAPLPPSPATDPGRAGPPTPFVCEDDVRAAIRESRPIVIGERTIVTPAARDLAATHGVFVER